MDQRPPSRGAGGHVWGSSLQTVSTVPMTRTLTSPGCISTPVQDQRRRKPCTEHGMATVLPSLGATIFILVFRLQSVKGRHQVGCRGMDENALRALAPPSAHSVPSL